MVRDAETGEVRGFLRGGQGDFEVAPSELEVLFSDGARSHSQPHTPHHQLGHKFLAPFARFIALRGQRFSVVHPTFVIPTAERRSRT